MLARTGVVELYDAVPTLYTYMADMTQKTIHTPTIKKKVSGTKNMLGVFPTKSLAASMTAVPSWMRDQQQQRIRK